eukprot:gene6748-9113_t
MLSGAAEINGHDQATDRHRRRPQQMVISGVAIPDSGQVAILGKAATSPHEARQLGISNVFQEVLVADECSVLDNLYLGADGLLGSSISREERYRKASDLMAELLGFEIDLNMRKMKRDGCAIMIVTHRIAELVRIADRATVLRDGVTVGTLEKEEITESRILALIAGPDREKAQSSQVAATRTSDSAVLRMTAVKVWPDAAAFDF